VYDPETTPSLQARVSLIQADPYETLADWYTITEAPLIIFLPFKVQSLAIGGLATVQFAYVALPDRIPLIHDRASL
jgi:hypothetical protein